MKCEYCDNVINNNLTVCPYCGAPLKKNITKIVKVINNNSLVVHQSELENKKNRFINIFLYSVIIGGIILIIFLLLLRFK